MSKPWVSDEFWAVVAPLRPKVPPKPNGGSPRISDRVALTEILFVLKSGIGQVFLSLGCSLGCWQSLTH